MNRPHRQRTIGSEVSAARRLTEIGDELARDSDNEQEEKSEDEDEDEDEDETGGSDGANNHEKKGNSEAPAVVQGKGLCACVQSVPRSLDDLIELARESKYVCSLFFLVLVMTGIFALFLLFVEENSEGQDVFLGLFGVFALGTVLIGSLLQVRNRSAKDVFPRFEWFARDNNGVRAFMLLEAVVDIVLGALSLTNEAVVGVAAGAIVFAVAAIAVLVLVPWRLRHRRTIFENHIAVVLTDSSDVLLLLRVIYLAEIDAKDILLFVFLVLNVLISEFSTLLAIRAEETTQAPPDEKDDERKIRLEQAIEWRKAMRNKALAQTVITGTFVKTQERPNSR